MYLNHYSRAYRLHRWRLPAGRLWRISGRRSTVRVRYTTTLWAAFFVLLCLPASTGGSVDGQSTSMVSFIQTARLYIPPCKQLYFRTLCFFFQINIKKRKTRLSSSFSAFLFSQHQAALFICFLLLIVAAYALLHRPRTAEAINSVSIPSVSQIQPPNSAMKIVIT